MNNSLFRWRGFFCAAVFMWTDVVSAAEPQKIQELKSHLYPRPDSAVWQLSYEIAETEDPRYIPYLIGLIDADNSLETLHGIGFLGLYKLTDVRFSLFHDGFWWRNWWTNNRQRFPESVASIDVPVYKKTKYGLTYKPLKIDLQSTGGLLVGLKKSVYEEDGFSRDTVDEIAQLLSERADPSVIPTMIGLIAANNGYDTIYDIGYFGLHELTGVSYSGIHDGGWWRDWWVEHRASFGDEFTKIDIPEFERTSDFRPPHGKNLDDPQDLIALMEEQVAEGQLESCLNLIDTAEVMVKSKNAQAVAALIGVMVAHGEHGSLYEIGYFGFRHLVEYDKSHDAQWWRNWWQENCTGFDGGEDVALPDYSELVGYGKERYRAQRLPGSERESSDHPNVNQPLTQDSITDFLVQGPKAIEKKP